MEKCSIVAFMSDQKLDYRGVARGGLRGLEIWQISKPYLNQRGQIMPLTLLPAPPDSKSYLHLCTTEKTAKIRKSLPTFLTLLSNAKKIGIFFSNFCGLQRISDFTIFDFVSYF